MGFSFRRSKGKSSGNTKAGMFQKTDSQDDHDIALPLMDFEKAIQDICCELSLFGDIKYMKDILEVDSFQKDMKSMAKACKGSVRRGPAGEPSYLERVLTGRSDSVVEERD